VGARTDAARAAAVASRGELAEEVARLEGSARAAVDIPAKIRRAPAKTAGLIAGAAFVGLGGPKRVLGRLNRAVRGPQAALPKSMLPNEVEKTLRKMGTDGDKVRGTLEREFASYVASKSEERKSRDLTATAALLAGSVLGPVTKRLGRQLAQDLFSPKGAGSDSFDGAVRKARERWMSGADRAADTPAADKPAADKPGPANKA